MRLLLALSLLAIAAFATADEAAAADQGPVWQRFFIMMFENHGWSQIKANPYWRAISESGLTLTQMFGITHPSQPNYIAQIGGDVFNVKNDAPTDVSAVPILTDLMEAKGVTWKTYQEAYTPKPGGDCDPVEQQNRLYWRKHNPFMSFDVIRKNKTRCQNIVNSRQLDADIAANNLPQFMYYTPDIKNDAHDTDLNYAGKFLTTWLSKYLAMPNFIKDTMVFITFDEDEYLESNHVTAIMLGPYIKHPNTTEGTRYDHYSVTRTLLDNWSLGSLKRHDATATSFLKAPGLARPRSDEDEQRDWAEVHESRQRPRRKHDIYGDAPETPAVRPPRGDRRKRAAASNADAGKRASRRRRK